MNRKKSSSFVVLLLLVAVVGGIVFLATSSMFERNAPKISLKSAKFWNLKKPLELRIQDESGLKAYQVVLKTSRGEDVLYNEQPLVPQKDTLLKIKPPRSAYAIKDKEVKLIVKATDTSKWNFLNGNTAIAEFVLYIDKRRPRLSVVTNSYKISKGGSALVIFRAKDENLKDLYISTNFNKKFKAIPFYKENYYISLIAWPVTKKSFRAYVEAVDEAGNKSKVYVPLYLKEKYYKVSNITLKDRFLKGKIAQLAEEFDETQGVDNSLEQFKIINEDVRAKNEDLIHEITSKVPDEMISDFRITPFYPLKNYAVVAHFGDHRKYYYDGEFISEAYHLGLDMASTAMAKIKTQNNAKVVFADFNGLYGNMPVLYHGLGLYTLYGHCSSIAVSSGDEVSSGEVIANTGKTGYAMGDHLHFGVLVQGIEVRPQEWMDKTWIKLNIYDVIKSAKKIMDKS